MTNEFLFSKEYLQGIFERLRVGLISVNQVKPQAPMAYKFAYVLSEYNICHYDAIGNFFTVYNKNTQDWVPLKQFEFEIYLIRLILYYNICKEEDDIVLGSTSETTLMGIQLELARFARTVVLYLKVIDIKKQT